MEINTNLKQKTIKFHAKKCMLLEKYRGDEQALHKFTIEYEKIKNNKKKHEEDRYWKSNVCLNHVGK